MTPLQAKQILLAYRPWATDALDLDVAEALDLCRQDTELAKWFEGHCAVQNAIHAQFKRMPIPEGLKEQIVSEYKLKVVPAWCRQPTLLATAAVAMLFIAISSLWFSLPRQPQEDVSFVAYRSRMVRTVIKAYGMDFVTNDMVQVRTYLAQHQAHADYVLPEHLDQTSSVGCGILSWQGKPVTMVCFRTGKPLSPGIKSDLFLFVIDQKDLANPPRSTTPAFTSVGKLATASWSESGKVYVLATSDESDLRRSF